MSDTRLAGLPVAWEWGGRTYWLGRPDFTLQLAFQAHQEDLARRRVLAHRRALGEEEYREQMAGWRRDLGANVYAFGGAESWRYLWTEPGFREYVWLKLKKGEAERRGEEEPVSRADLDALFADAEAVRDLNLFVRECDFPNLVGPEEREERARAKAPTSTSPPAAP